MNDLLSLNNVLLLVFLASVVTTLIGLAMQRSLLWRSALVVAVLSLCGWGLYPPEDKLQLGLDLRGGTSLLYDVTVPEGADRQRALEQTVDVLSRRVDPDGVRNISWRIDQAGRIEIQMPRASAEVSRLREAFEQAKATVAEANLQRGKLLAALAAGEDRQAQLDGLVLGVEARKPLLAAAAAAYDATQQAKADMAAAGNDAANRAELALKVAAADLALNEAVDAVMATNVDMTRLQNTLEMSTVNKRDDQTREAIPDSSPRAVALARMVGGLAGRAETIDAAVAAYDAYADKKGPLEDAEDLIRMLRGSGVLEFRITVNPNEAPMADQLRRQLLERGPRATAGEDMVWLPIDDPRRFADTTAEREALAKDPQGFLAGRGLIGADYGGEAYILMWNTDDKSMAKRPSQSGWGLRNVGATVDNNFFPAVAFTLNPIGAQLMSRMSGANIRRQMGIVLDGRVISTPTIQSKLASNVMISGGTGGFTGAEQNYLIRTLQAGSLDARLGEEPISITKVGSQYGQDNLNKGLVAARDALIIVGLFMMVYYFFAGAVANFALVSNVVVILGIMSLRQAAFTLPGIAGVVLTIGMCVDANVLVFERIREELERGQDMLTALRLGYKRALSAIVDGNLTNLIVCVILYQTASADVRGFAVTLGIGIGGTLFTSLFMTRVIFDLWHRAFHIKHMRMLPIVLPPLARLLNPAIKWVQMRWVFMTISAGAILLSLVFCIERGVDLLDIEFRGGTQVTFELKPIGDEKRMAMPLGEVRDRVTEVGKWFAPNFDPAGLSADDRPTYDRLIQRVAERRKELDAERWSKVQTAGTLEKLQGEELEATKQQLTEQFATEIAEATDLQQMADATVTTVGEVGENYTASQFNVATTVSDSRTVAAVIKLLFDEKIDTTSSIRFQGRELENVTQAASIVFPITRNQLEQVINQPTTGATQQSVQAYIGGVAIVVSNLDPVTTVQDIEGRIKAMRLMPDYEGVAYREFEVIGLTRSADNPSLFASAVVVSRDANVSYFESPENWEVMAQTEWSLVRDALSRDKSLSSVSNFTPTVARTIQQQAIVALLLSFIAIIAYIWFRFGSLRFGLAATVALVHDVSIAMGFIALSTYLYSWLGPDNVLLITPYKINLALIAALLTIVGYSLNDTIIVFDRIRENRGKLATATAGIIDLSINQTISRTVLTSGTTLLAVMMLYVFGGEGVREFAFALLIGVLVGTYSSIAVAAPILTIGHGKPYSKGEEAAAALAPATE
jgi:SecD/SecF fusion protein